MTGLQVGRMVHYLRGQAHLAAIVSEVVDKEKGVVNLHVFHQESGSSFVREVGYSDQVGETNTWHWPERDDDEETAPLAEAGAAVPSSSSPETSSAPG